MKSGSLCKMISSPRSAEGLFDCSKDPQQAHNLISDAAYRKETVRLRNVLKQWQRQTGDTEPDSLTPDWYDRMTGKNRSARGTRGEMPGATKGADTINTKGPF